MQTVEELLLDLVEVRLKNIDDDFFKIRETLTRIGVASAHKNILYQSCHILRKRGKYYITHFKELFKLDNKPSSLTQEDIARRNTIVNMLQEWGLLEVIDTSKTQAPLVSHTMIKIIKFEDKENWILQAKYQIGKKKLHRKIDEIKKDQ